LFKIRNPKLEIPNKFKWLKNPMLQTLEIGFEVLDFLGLEFILASVGFEFRASNFVLSILG